MRTFTCSDTEITGTTGDNDIGDQVATGHVLLSRSQVAQALGISLDSLDRLHARGEGPPRFRTSPRRWGYPTLLLRRWQTERLRFAEHVA